MLCATAWDAGGLSRRVEGWGFRHYCMHYCLSHASPRSRIPDACPCEHTPPGRRASVSPRHLPQGEAGCIKSWGSSCGRPLQSTEDKDVQDPCKSSSFSFDFSRLGRLPNRRWTEPTSSRVADSVGGIVRFKRRAESLRFRFWHPRRSFVSGPSRPDTHPHAPKRRAWESHTQI